MPFEIKSSQIDNDKDGFAKAVQNHISDLTNFNKMKGRPRPVAHPLVEQAIKRVQYPIKARRPDEYLADYTVIDDSPKNQPPSPATPVLSLEDKKQLLSNKLYAAQQEAMCKAYPRRKMSLLNLHLRQVAIKPDSELTEEQLEAKNTQERLQVVFAKISELVARTDAAIEDLTEANIDNFELPLIDP